MIMEREFSHFHFPFQIETRNGAGRIIVILPLDLLAFDTSIRLEHFDEGFLRDIDFPERFHAFLAFLLLFQKFAFA